MLVLLGNVQGREIWYLKFHNFPGSVSTLYSYGRRKLVEVARTGLFSHPDTIPKSQLNASTGGRSVLKTVCILI